MNDHQVFSVGIVNNNLELDCFNLSTQVVNALNKYGIYTVEDLKKIPDEQTLFDIRGIGQKALSYIKEEYKRLFKEDLFKDNRINTKKYQKNIRPRFEIIERSLESKYLQKNNSLLSIKPFKQDPIDPKYFPEKTAFTIKKIDHRKIRILNKEQARKMIETKKLYDKLGTLQKVAKNLNITRERVRQLLQRGSKLGLYKYRKSSEMRLAILMNRIKKEDLIKAINIDKTIFEQCSLFNINLNQYFKLIKIYNIDIVDHRIDAKRRKFITKYMAIVDFLGHHPSTTEMNSKPEWRNTWFGIDRCWGGIDKFRVEYGIEKPSFKFHPNTLQAWKKQVIKRQLIKQKKIEKLINLIKEKREVDLSKIIQSLGYSHALTSAYLKYLYEKQIIKKRRVGIKNFYSLIN